MEQSTVTTKGRITIPQAIREHMGLKPGDRVRYVLRPDGVAAVLSVVPAAKPSAAVRRED